MVVATNKNNSPIDNLLRVEIESILSEGGGNTTTFYVPVSLMLQREIEMQEAARAYKIGRERWSSSRLFRMWKAQSIRQRQQQQQQDQQQEQVYPCLGSSREMTLQMAPEVSLQSTSSFRFRWKPWLTSCIRAYYNTGSLRIPNECQGDDVLLALEYFGILTASPDSFVFESRRAYGRIQAWSRYFSHRAELAETILDDHDYLLDVDDNNDAKGVLERPHVWVLFPGQDTSKLEDAQTSLRVGGETARRLLSGTQGGLYDLFVGPSRDVSTAAVDNLTKEMPARLRQDFCEFLRQSLPPRTAVHFDLQEIIKMPPIATDAKREIQPVIWIEPDAGDAPEPFLDDLRQAVEEDVRNLEKGAEDVKSAGSCKNTPLNDNCYKSVHDVSLVSTSIESSDRFAPKYKMSPTCSTTWNGSTLEFGGSVSHSPNTKTLLGEGISGAIATINTADMRVKALFPATDPTDLNDRISPAKDLPMRTRMADHHSSSASMRIRNQSLAVADAVAFVAYDPKQEEKAQMIEQGGYIGLAAPVKCINTEFGDLRSVTSMLTDPVGEDSSAAVTFRSPPNAMTETTKKIMEGGSAMRAASHQGIEEPLSFFEGAGRPPRDSYFRDHLMSATEGQARFTPAKPPNGPQPTSSESVAMSPPPRLTRTTVAHSPPWIDDEMEGSKDEADSSYTPVGQALARSSQALNERSGSTRQADDSWAKFIATVCEAVIPAPSNNDISRSPTREFSNAATVARPSNVAPTREINHDSMANQSEQLMDMDRFLVASMLTNPDGFLEQAKQIGNDISISFDALMKIALEGTEDEGLATIPEEGTEGVSIARDEEYLTDSHRASSSSDRRKKSNNGMYTIKYQKARKKRSSDRCKSNIATESSGGVMEIPKSRSFDSDSLASSSVQMPPRRGDSRSRRPSRDKLTVARKRSSSSTGSAEMKSPADSEGLGQRFQNECTPLGPPLVSSLSRSNHHQRNRKEKFEC